MFALSVTSHICLSIVSQELNIGTLTVLPKVPYFAED